MTLLLIAFDLEGTLLDGEFFPEVGRRLDLGDELDAITRDAMNGDLPFEEAIRRRVELIRGFSISSVKSVADSIPFTDGAEETVATLRDMGFTPAIVTGGFDFLADRAAERLKISHVFANRLIDEGGSVAGLVEPILTPLAKAEHFERLANRLNTPLRRCVAVGDGANDIPMLRAAGLGIAFDAPHRVREAAHAVAEGKDMRAIVQIVARHIDEAPAQVSEVHLVETPRGLGR